MGLLSNVVTPYDDELLYSVCARYKSRMPIKSQMLNHLLFNVQIHRQSYDLPKGIGYFCKINQYDFEKILFENTLFPLFSAFMNKKNKYLLKIGMEEFFTLNIHRISCLNFSYIKKSNLLKYCPVCCQKDEQEFGEPYWHRSHQTPGVFVCYSHHVPLIKVPLRVSISNNYFKYVPLSIDLLGKEYQLNEKNFYQAVFYAECMHYILNYYKLNENSNEIKKKFDNVIKDLRKNFKKKSTQEKQKKLKKINMDISDYYGISFLELVESEFSTVNIFYVIEKILLSESFSHNPLPNILLMKFMGVQPFDNLDKLAA